MVLAPVHHSAALCVFSWLISLMPGAVLLREHAPFHLCNTSASTHQAYMLFVQDYKIVAKLIVISDVRCEWRDQDEREANSDQ